MDKQAIQDRITKLETEREQLRTTLIAYEGALEDCKYWLQQGEMPAVTDTEKETDGEVNVS